MELRLPRPRGAVRLAAAARLPAAAVLALAAACTPVGEHKLAGGTMGTTYHVTVVGRPPAPGLQRRIEARLDQLEAAFSTYRADSEISRFNRWPVAGQPFPVSADFVHVMQVARRVFELSEGAWDGTVMPLVDLWGFGPAGPVAEPPADREIAARLARVGFAKIEVRQPGALVKGRADVTLDLSSIAKGYGVDEIAALLRRESFARFMVEIGGEVYAAGARLDGRSWRVGVNRPRRDAVPDDVYRVVALREAALATSGDYRQQFESGGVRYSHVIDPRSGRPAANHVVSVTILGPDCTLADGLATAVMVMGARSGLALVERLEGVEALVVVETEHGRLEDHASSGMRVE